MSGGRSAPSLNTGRLTSDSSRFVPKVNKTLHAEAFVLRGDPARTSLTPTYLAEFRRAFLAQLALDRERGRR